MYEFFLIYLVYPWSVFLGLKSENDPRWVVFENLSNLTKVRVPAGAYGLDDQGFGTGLVARWCRGGEIDDNGVLNFGGPTVN